MKPYNLIDLIKILRLLKKLIIEKSMIVCKMTRVSNK